LFVTCDLIKPTRFTTIVKLLDSRKGKKKKEREREREREKYSNRKNYKNKRVKK